MTKTNSTYLAIALSCLVVASTSCSKERDTAGNSSGDLEIRLAASTVELTRAGDDYFDDGDELGLTVVKWLDGTAQDLTGIRQENNVRFTKQAGEFTASSAAYYPDRTSKCTFFAYYPYNNTGFARDKNILEINVNTDQSEYESYAGSDYMIAVKEEVQPSTTKVALSFRHVLSKVTINMISGAGCTVEDLKTAEITLKSMLTKAEYDVMKSALENVSAKSDIRVCKNYKESAGRLDGACAIVAPHTFPAKESMIYFVINDKTLAYKPTQEVVFESGKEYTFNVTVSVTNLGPSISVSSRISEWTDGGKITGNADEETPYKGTVTDIEGNVYRYVEINGLYWTAANLKTTKYNDGTDIPYQEGGGKPWMALTTPAWCYFKNLPENKEKLGVLYNYYVIQTGKICPAGWRMPTKDELSLLIGEEDGSVDAQTLISEEWEGEKGTNKTGFSAMPTGMAMDHWYMTDCYLWSGTIDDTAEGSSKYGYLYMARYPWTDFHNPEVGMGVRCVKNIE